MKINGYEYTDQEVLDALRKKGYAIVSFKNYWEQEIHGSGFQKQWFDTFCAIRPGEEPTEQTQWQNVAIREFQKESVKPPLS